VHERDDCRSGGGPNGTPVQRIEFVFNWKEELKQRVPVK